MEEGEDGGRGGGRERQRKGGREGGKKEALVWGVGLHTKKTEIIFAEGKTC